MFFFSKSLKTLLKEKAVLEARLNAEASSLAAKGPITVELAQERLKPLTLPLVVLERKIRARTPLRQLVARRDELKSLIESSERNSSSRWELEHELLILDMDIEPRTRGAISPRQAAAIILAIVGLPIVIVLVQRYFGY